MKKIELSKKLVNQLTDFLNSDNKLLTKCLIDKGIVNYLNKNFFNKFNLVLIITLYNFGHRVNIIDNNLPALNYVIFDTIFYKIDETTLKDFIKIILEKI